MVQEVRSWIRENSTLVYFLIGQMLVLGGAGASALAYFTRLETRVTILETRGAAYSVRRMDEMANQIAVLQEKIENNENSIKRIVETYLRDRDRQQR